MVIVYVLMHDPREDSNHIPEIQNFAMNWILLQLLEDSNSSLTRFIWSLPPSTLTSVSSKFPSFHSFYVDHLTKMAQSLQLEFNGWGKKWNKRCVYFRLLKFTYTI